MLHILAEVSINQSNLLEFRPKYFLREKDQNSLIMMPIKIKPIFKKLF